METITKINDEEIEYSILKDIPLTFVKSNLFLPLRRHEGELLGAVAGNRGIFALRALARKLDLKPRPLQAKESFIIETINRI